MKRIIPLIIFLIFTGCSDNLVLSHHSTLPVLTLPEQGDPVKARSFTVAGEISYLHEEKYAIQHEDSLALPGVKNYEESNTSSSKFLYYPRLQFAGKWGFNPSRYFTIGFQGSLGAMHTTPDIISSNTTNLSGTMGIWMRAGGPLRGNPNISIVGSMSHLAGFTPSYYRTFPVDDFTNAIDSNNVEISLIIEQSVAIQFRPYNKFGFFFGYAHMPFTSDYFSTFIHTYTGLGYSGISIPIRDTQILSLRGGVQFGVAEETVQPRISLQWSSNPEVR